MLVRINLVFSKSVVYNYLRFSLTCSNCTRYSQSTGTRNSSQAQVIQPMETYKLVYKLPVIRVAGIVGKSKLYQTWITCLAIPSSFALEYASLISHEAAIPIAVSLVGLTATIATYCVGTICHRLVGFIYITPDNSKVKISHLNFWGRRIDNIYQTDDIVPISELPDNPSSTYVNIKRYSSKQDSLKLSVKYGAIQDIDLFRKIFGYMQ